MPRRSTRGSHGSGTIRQRPDGRWEARYTVGRDPCTGKQIQKSVYANTQREASQKLRAVTADIDKGIYAESSSMTLSSWLEAWIKDFCPDVKPRTRELYESAIRTRIIPAIGKVKLSSLTPAIIQRFYNACSEGDNPLSAKTIRNIHGILHRALQQAVDAKYIPSNPSDACKPPRLQQPEIKPLDDDQTRAFLAAIVGDPFEALFKVALFTGMREGELLGLQWNDIDFSSGTIRITQQLQQRKGEYVLATPKNSKPRCITPAPFVMNTLKAVRRDQMQKQLLAGGAWTNTGFVFTDDLGGHVARNTVYMHFKRIVEKIGIPSARFHDLRHTYAVASLRAGDDPKTVSENLGHATVSFTLDVYGHVTAQMKQASANRMQAYIDSIT